ncbi:MAG: biopolymer transporter ExbD [Arcobacteraceae bacterium]
MKRFRNRKTKEETEINLTPMLDVVFIMLIFFIVTTSFVKEAGVQVNRPSATTAEQKGKANIIVAIRSNDEIWIDKRIVDLRAVRANIEKLKSLNSQNSIVIQSDKEAKTDTLIKVMDQIRLAGIHEISISALKN